MSPRTMPYLVAGPGYESWTLPPPACGLEQRGFDWRWTPALARLHRMRKECPDPSWHFDPEDEEYEGCSESDLMAIEAEVRSWHEYQERVRDLPWEKPGWHSPREHIVSFYEPFTDEHYYVPYVVTPPILF